MAKSTQYNKADPPSSWVILLVGVLLILVPTLFCAGVLLTKPSVSQPGQQAGQEAPLKRPQGSP